VSAPKKRVVCIDDFVVLITVDCCDEKHKIGLTKTGKLSFFDHDGESIGTEESLRKLGDMDSGSKCGKVHRAWVEGGDWRNPLPDPLDDWREHFLAERNKRKEHAVNTQDPLADLSPRQRFDQRIRETAKEVLGACTYRRGKHSHVDRVLVNADRKVAGVSTTYDARTRVLSWGDDPVRQVSTSFTVTVPLRWYLHVYKAGISMIDNQFVVDTIGPRRANGQLLRVLKQSRGYKLQLRTALFTPRGALRWL